MSNASNNKSARQVDIRHQPLNHSHAFVSHTSSSLKDSKVLWPSDGSHIHTIALKDEELVAVTRTLGDFFGGRSAEEVLAGFCQKIFLLFKTDTRALGVASVIAEQLFKCFDGKGSFARELMPLGIQGVQELNWTTQNEELAPLREGYQRKMKEEGRPLTPFSMTDSNGSELLFAGPEEETLIMIDKTMLSAGLVKYRHHTFDIGLDRAKCSWQVFVKIKHRDFVRSWFRSSLAPVQDMAVAVMMAMRIFSEARHFISKPERRTEATVLVEAIRRGEFYTNSTVVDEETAATPETLPPSDGDVSAEDGSGRTISAAPDSLSQSNNSYSRLPPSSTSSPSSSSSSGSSSTMGESLAPDPTADVPAVSTKKSKKKRQVKKKPHKKTAAQTQMLSSEGKQPSEDKDVAGVADKMAAIALSGPSTIPSCTATPILPAVQSGGENSTKSTSAPPSRELKQKGRDGKLSKTRAAEELEQDLDDTSQRSSDSDRTVTQADFSNKDVVAISSSTKGQQDNQHNQQGGGDEKGKRQPGKEDETPKPNFQSQPTASTRGGSEPSNHGQFVGPEPQPPSAGFKFDSFDPRLRCLKPDCRNMTSCWDCAVVICPACGTDSFTRYCRKQHLYDDMQRHWAMDCGRNKIVGPIDRDTIRPRQLPKRPYICGQYHDIIERHRQAVYRAMEDADYFIFNDVEMLDDGIVYPTQEQWNSVRGTGEVALQIFFPDDMTPQSDKQLFNYHIQRILSVGKPMAEDSCMRALEMIRSALVTSGSWTEEALTYLCMQLTGEWGNFKVPERFYNVDEVNAMWQMHHVLLLA